MEVTTVDQFAEGQAAAAGQDAEHGVHHSLMMALVARVWGSKQVF
jgi:hypothetical protein